MKRLMIYPRLLSLVLFAVAPASAQAPADPLSRDAKAMYTMVKNNLLRSAEKMPEESYSYKPTPEVRSFGQLLGHVADAQYLFCSAVAGEKSPAPGVEKSKTSKADLLQGLKDGFAYCDKVYDGMSDRQASLAVKFFGREQAKLSILSFNTVHNNEHYGNVVTYLRMKGIVPPSSEGR